MKQNFDIDFDRYFTVDSKEYLVLENALLKTRNVDGAIVEIGTRLGGSTKLMIDALAYNNDIGRPLFAIDPYGNIPCEVTNKAVVVHHPDQKDLVENDSVNESKHYLFDFTNEMRNHAIPWLYYYAFMKKIEFHFFNMEDTEFFKRFSDGVPLYDRQKFILNLYALVFFDGPHTNSVVQEEIDFFLPRTEIGSMFVFDDIWMYDHDMIEEQLFEAGWEVMDRLNIKASYKKVK